MRIGYGFDSYDLSRKDLYDFVKKFDKEAYDSYIKDNPDLSEEDLIEDISDLIRNNYYDYCFIASYIVDTIAQDLLDKHITSKENQILESFDNFVVFTPVQFSDDEKTKSELIKNKDDLIKLIKDYFPNAKINWGDIKEAGADWIDTEYVIN